MWFTRNKNSFVIKFTSEKTKTINIHKKTFSQHKSHNKFLRAIQVQSQKFTLWMLELECPENVNITLNRELSPEVAPKEPKAEIYLIYWRVASLFPSIIYSANLFLFRFFIWEKGSPKVVSLTFDAAQISVDIGYKL